MKNGAAQKDWTPEEMEKRTARFSRLKARPMTFLDAALPEYERDIYNIIGAGVSEEPGEPEPEITAVEGFNIQMAKVPPGNGNALHSHDTVEVFFFMDGKWEVRFGPNGENLVVLERFDFISVPAGLMRCFKNISDQPAHMFSVLGGDDAGQLTWHPALVETVRRKGYVIENGKLARVA